ncbi:hypothetical protein J1605_014709 [Eschrichtius robustus]|uniref:Uncharacterized protein n=1 Tax=Eschrichtius robustus TaxID=9764 RepID=A0AB34GBT6_ESCRO|nr:hypothetical protein J1605_014709 [Eschrichtius robustus]
MWDLPGPGLEPASPALAGGFLTTVPPGKPWAFLRMTKHRLQTRRLSSCGSRAQLLRGMWDPPRPGLESVSPALAGGFSTTAPPGKPLLDGFFMQPRKYQPLPDPG